MLPIILTILKITGIVLLILLGLICLIVFVVLVIPVRYRLSGSYGEAVQAKGAVTWLLHAISVTITYEKELDVSVRILGKKLSDKKRKKESAPADDEEVTGEPSDEFSEDDVSPGGLLEDDISLNGLSEEGFPSDGQEEDTDLSGKKKSKKKRSEKAGEDSGKAGEKLGAALDSVKEKWKHLKEKKEELEAFLKNEANQQTFKLVLRELKKLLRHILPTKIRGKAVIGFEDPATTGKVLSGLSVLYAWYGDSIEITPIFDQAILEAEGNLKGRIRIGTILLCCVRVLLNKNFRRLVRKMRRSGGKKDGR